MIGLYIAAGVILVLLALLFYPVTVSVLYRVDVTVKVRILFVSVRLFPGKEKKKQKGKKEKAKKEKPAEEKLKKPVAEKLNDITALTKKLLIKLDRLIGHIHVHKFILRITLSGDDAFQVARLYPVCAGAAASLAALIDSRVASFHRDIYIDTDYWSGENSNVGLFAKVSVKPFFAVTAGVGMLLDFLKFKNTDKNKNMKNSKMRKEASL